MYELEHIDLPVKELGKNMYLKTCTYRPPYDRAKKLSVSISIHKYLPMTVLGNTYVCKCGI